MSDDKYDLHARVSRLEEVVLGEAGLVSRLYKIEEKIDDINQKISSLNSKLSSAWGVVTFVVAGIAALITAVITKLVKS